MRRDQALTRLPQLSARIAAWETAERKAERAGDVTAWDDARRNIKKLKDEKQRIIREHH